MGSLSPSSLSPLCLSSPRFVGSFLFPTPQPPLPFILPSSDASPLFYKEALRPKLPAPTQLTDEDLLRLRKVYPNHVRVPSPVLSEGAQPYSFSLVGKFLSRTLSLDQVTSYFQSKWSPQSDWEFNPMNYGFFLLRFTCVEDKDFVIVGGPWVLDDATLALEPWIPAFLPSSKRLPRTILWLRLPDLPPICWNEAALRIIVGAAGKFIRMDDSTTMATKGRFARVAVEIDTSNPLIPGTDVELEGLDLPVFWQRFEYEHIHLFCARCSRVGHRSPTCSFAPIGRTSPNSDVSMEPADAATQGSDAHSTPSNPQVADDEQLPPPPWIHNKLRGRHDSGAAARTRDSARAVAAPSYSRDHARATSGAPQTSREAKTSGSHHSVVAKQAFPRDRPSAHISAGYFGPLGSNVVGPLGSNFTSASAEAPGLLGTGPMPNSGAADASMQTPLAHTPFGLNICGAAEGGSLLEALPNSSPSASLSTPAVPSSSSPRPPVGETDEQILARFRATLDPNSMPHHEDFDMDNMMLSERIAAMGKGKTGGKLGKKKNKNKKHRPYSPPKDLDNDAFMADLPGKNETRKQQASAVREGDSSANTDDVSLVQAFLDSRHFDESITEEELVLAIVVENPPNAEMIIDALLRINKDNFDNEKFDSNDPLLSSEDVERRYGRGSGS